MIIPRTRLIAWSALVLVPLGAVAGTSPAALAAAGLAAGLFAVLVIADAFAARGRLWGLGIDLPEVVRLQRRREGEIELLIRNEPARARAIRIGLLFPPETGAIFH